MITVKTTIEGNIQKVWECWTQPDHITHWNFASPEWHCPSAINKLNPDGKFSWRMEAIDGSFGFDFEGRYRHIEENKSIKKELADGRQVEIHFRDNNGLVEVEQLFQPDNEYSLDMQREGWQAILDNFKAYVETIK